MNILFGTKLLASYHSKYQFVLMFFSLSYFEYMCPIKSYASYKEPGKDIVRRFLKELHQVLTGSFKP